MPPKNKGKSKGNNRKRYTSHVVDTSAATEARLKPMPVNSTASSCSGIFGEVSYTSQYNFYLFDTYDVIFSTILISMKLDLIFYVCYYFNLHC